MTRNNKLRETDIKKSFIINNKDLDSTDKKKLKKNIKIFLLHWCKVSNDRKPLHIIFNKIKKLDLIHMMICL